MTNTIDALVAAIVMAKESLLDVIVELPEAYPRQLSSDISPGLTNAPIH